MGEGKDTLTAEEEKEAHKRLPWWKRLWARTGFGDKTLWDVLQLLVIPLALAVIGFWFAAQQDARQQQIENRRAEAERELAAQRAQDEALQAYLDQMGSLLLEKDLRNSEEDSEVRTLARARTVTVMQRLDSDRNSNVIRFLKEAGLIGQGESSIRLLAEADLRGAHLHDIDLTGADLSSADLTGAYLYGAELGRADLHEADLRYADLGFARVANLSGADLSEANLNGADLSEANLNGADLRYADLSGADLGGTDLDQANLSGAGGITNEKLKQQAASLQGATMPNGQKYEDWLKSREEGDSGP